jgi:hypothetical protein
MNTVQKGDRAVDADDLGSAFSQGDSIPSMTATDISDLRVRCKLEQVP